MQYKRLISAQAFLLLLLGVLLTLMSYGAFTWLNLFLKPGWQKGLPYESRGEIMQTYYRLALFVPFAGCWMLGTGLFTWLSRDIGEVFQQRKVALLLFLLNTYNAYLVICLDTGLNFHTVRPSWVYLSTAALFFVPALCWLFWLLFHLELEPTVLPSEITALQEQWAQQIGLAAAQEERSRLARELHDSIKQQLFSIHVSAATVQARWASDPLGTQSALADVRERVREALTEMEAMLQNLRPTPLVNFGLVEALRREAEALQFRTGVQVSTEFGALPPEAEFPPGAQENLFRIAQEAISNIARHARAQNVQLRLHHPANDNHDAIWLCISDDGIGIAPTTSEGLGLANIRTRVCQHGGTLQLETQPGCGTQLVVTIPLQTSALSTAVTQKLALAFFSALTAFLGFGFGPTIRSSYTHIIFGSALFGVSALCLWWVRWQLRQSQPLQAIAQHKHFITRLSWYYVVALLWVVFFWSVVRWLVLLEGISKSNLLLQWVVWNLKMPDFMLHSPGWLLVSLWFMPLLISLFFAHRVIEAEAAFHPKQEFQQIITQAWKTTLPYFAFTGLTMAWLAWLFFPLKSPFILVTFILLSWSQLSWQRLAARRKSIHA